MERVIQLFRALCAIPHSSGDMDKIASYCISFAQGLGLAALRDEANNVIIKKEGSGRLKDAPPVILQGHMDMVCQKRPDIKIDFASQGVTPVIEGDFMRACGTTLGADNGIAVAMILALLEREDLVHPPIEAVLTTDEEIGMIGAGKLDGSLLSGRRMINLDGEEDTVTVSCAGGSDLILTYPAPATEQKGFGVDISFSGLQGGHSGVEIHKGRVNAATFMGRFLSAVSKRFPVLLVDVFSGEKANAIPFCAKARILVEEKEAFLAFAEKTLLEMKREIAPREGDFSFEIECLGEGQFFASSKEDSKRIFDALCSVPCGVMEMSPSIPDLVQTSLNLGILKSGDGCVSAHFALRSNVASALFALEEKMLSFASLSGAKAETFGHYPPWEYRQDSPLREAYLDVCREDSGKEVPVVALHAGLECGVFSAKIPDLDCIAIGPDLFEVHTPREAMFLPSVERIYGRLVTLLSKLK